MRNYELTYLISPDLSEEELKILSGKVNSFIREETGILEKTTEPSKKRLGYPIKKKREAFSNTLIFSFRPTADQSQAGNSEKLENLEKKLKSENQILRYIILIKKAPEKTKTKRTLSKVEKPLKTPQKTAESKKVELKEIDKKIEEILNE